MNKEFNCAGFAFGTYQWEDLWNPISTKEAIDSCYGHGWDSDIIHNHIKHNLILVLEHEIKDRFNYTPIKICNIAEAPIGTVAMRIRYNVFSTDYHFARKEMVEGEQCWIHKPGSQALDIMFDEDIISDAWEGGYDSQVIFFTKERR